MFRNVLTAEGSSNIRIVASLIYLLIIRNDDWYWRYRVDQEVKKPPRAFLEKPALVWRLWWLQTLLFYLPVWWLTIWSSLGLRSFIFFMILIWLMWVLLRWEADSPRTLLIFWMKAQVRDRRSGGAWRKRSLTWDPGGDPWGAFWDWGSSSGGQWRGSSFLLWVRTPSFDNYYLLYLRIIWFLIKRQPQSPETAKLEEFTGCGAEGDPAGFYLGLFKELLVLDWISGVYHKLYIILSKVLGVLFDQWKACVGFYLALKRVFNVNGSDNPIR